MIHACTHTHKLSTVTLVHMHRALINIDYLQLMCTCKKSNFSYVTSELFVHLGKEYVHPHMCGHSKTSLLEIHVIYLLEYLRIQKYFVWLN